MHKEIADQAQEIISEEVLVDRQPFVFQLTTMTEIAEEVLEVFMLANGREDFMGVPSSDQRILVTRTDDCKQIAN
ncbi:hypothetical protein NPIL_144081 [Nephila pilipes]|uniref:Uncharacterized protein n=1 Tax=Nephila pilipes TaxID=299642 RepID=A0A8X6T1B8_NEPPI|nr:hypothetical protein NPIL_144081 [Nephila pilipes]